MWRSEIGDGIPGAAEVLARALRGTHEWEEWRAAKSAFDGDADLARLLARYRELAGRWRIAQARGGGMMGPESTELAEVQEKIQGNALFSRHQEAGNALMEMLRQANRVLSDKLGIDFAANAAPRGGGCCG
jgi:cell fate (sporulation/competence/biofilm development) regulator YlbF (YheA/YmcA/DUF963 family)